MMRYIPVLDIIKIIFTHYQQTIFILSQISVCVHIYTYIYIHEYIHIFVHVCVCILEITEEQKKSQNFNAYNYWS
jgi:hypothetical protein